MELRKFIQTTICEYFNENENTKYSVGDVISCSEMVNYILDNNLRDAGGKIDYNEAKKIAYVSDKWTLQMVSLENFNWFTDSKYKNKSTKAFPIILKVDDGYEVLDGKHRIGMYNDMEIKYHLMWVGEL